MLLSLRVFQTLAFLLPLAVLLPLESVSAGSNRFSFTHFQIAAGESLVIECHNSGSDSAAANFSLRNRRGQKIGSQSISLSPHETRHALLSNIESGSRGLLEMRTADDALRCALFRYALSPEASHEAVSQALATPFVPPMRGVTAHTLNQQHPTSRANSVSNVLHITNLSSKSFSATVRLYDSSGRLLKRLSLRKLKARAQSAIPLDFGSGAIGLVRIVPQNSGHPYIASLVRSSADEQYAASTLSSTLLSSGTCDTGSVPFRPYERAKQYVEISNPTGHSMRLAFEVRNDDAKLLKSEVLTLAPLASTRRSLSKYAARLTSGSFRVGCVDPESLMLPVVQTVAFAHHEAQPEALEWFFAMPLGGENAYSATLLLNTFLGAKNLFYVASYDNRRARVTTRIFDSSGTKSRRSTLSSASATRSLSLARRISADTIAAATVAADGVAYVSPLLLRVYPTAKGESGVIAYVPALAGARKSAPETEWTRPWFCSWLRKSGSIYRSRCIPPPPPPPASSSTSSSAGSFSSSTSTSSSAFPSSSSSSSSGLPASSSSTSSSHGGSSSSSSSSSSAISSSSTSSSSSAAVSSSSSTSSSGGPTRPIATNLEGIRDWSSSVYFTDVMKTARRWNSVQDIYGAGPVERPILGPGGIAVDANGWPTEMPQIVDGKTALVRSFIMTTANTWPTGTYTIFYDGEPKTAGTSPLYIGGPVTNVQFFPSERKYTFHYTRGNYAIGLIIQSSKLGNHIRNIQIILPGLVDNANRRPTQTWNPEFVAAVQPFPALRFMDLIQTNRSPETTWAKRTPKNYYTQADDADNERGDAKAVAYEWLIQMGNDLGKDMWFTIPHQADDNYVRSLATLIRDTMAPGRKAYIEWSNEVWNTGYAFISGLYAEQKAEEQGIYSATPGQGITDNRFQSRLFYQARRSGEIFKIFAEVFGSQLSGRVVKVVGSQSANIWISEQVLEGLADPAINPSGARADAVAIAPYFGYSIADDIYTAGEINSVTVDQIIDRAVTHMRQVVPYDTSRHYSMAQQFGVKLFAYEGGQHLVQARTPFDSTLTSKLMAANRSPRMRGIYLEYFDTWFANGGDLFMNFSLSGTYGNYGSWGILERFDQDPQTAPKYLGTLDALASE